MKFAAGITLYNPNREQLERLNLLSKSFCHVFAFDNSEPCYQKPEVMMNENVAIFTEGENKGLSYAYNTIINKCDNYDYLCTLDQDSTFTKEDIQKMCKKINDLEDNKDIGIVAPFIDYGYERYSLCDKMEYRHWVITSGSFMNLRVIREYNLKYDENYFIDKFEIDMCQQMLQIGKKVMMYHGAVLHQQLGEESGHSYPNHNALRHYYLFRNRFYFNKKWHRPLKRYFLNLAQTIKHIYLIIAYEENKVDKIASLVQAFRDYKEGRFGKWERRI